MVDMLYFAPPPPSPAVTMQVLGLGLRLWWSDNWNRLDFVLIGASVALKFVVTIASANSLVGNAVLFVVLSIGLQFGLHCIASHRLALYCCCC